MAHYMFETEWLLSAPIDGVFDLISHPENYGTWWPHVSQSHILRQGDVAGLGHTAAYVVRGPFGLRARFELKTIATDEPVSFRSLVRGDFVGTSAVYLEARQQGTLVRLHWHVSSTKRWIDVFTAVARPVFAFAHRYVMYEGCRGMAQELGARLLTAESRMVAVPTPIPVPQE